MLFLALPIVRFTPIGGQDVNKPLPYNPRDPVSQQIKTSFQRSLENLQTTYIDSYLLHSPLRTLDLTMEAWRTLAALQDEGKVRLIGISNAYDIDVLHALSRERKVQVVQNRWYEGNEWDRQVLNYCREHDILYQYVTDGLLIYFCFDDNRSFWTLSGSPTLLSHPALLAVAKAANRTPAQAVFKFVQSEGIIPLSGTTSELHMKEDLSVERIEFSPDLEVHLNTIKGFVRG